MTSDEYILWRLGVHKLPEKLDEAAELALVKPLGEHIVYWAGDGLGEITLTGARAKGTAIDASSELDYMITFNENEPHGVGELYESLWLYFTDLGCKTIRRDAAISVLFGGRIVDLIPAKRTSGDGGEREIYLYKQRRAVVTNPEAHIKRVAESGRENDIMTLKLWRDNHNVPLPTLFIETLVLETLKGESKGSVAEHFERLLKRLWGGLDSMCIADPANPENALLAGLTEREREKLRGDAFAYMSEDFCSDLLW